MCRGGGGGGGLLKFSRLIYCGPGVYIESRISPKYAAYAPIFRLLLEGKGVVCPMHGWFWNL